MASKPLHRSKETSMRGWVICFFWILAFAAFAGPKEDAAQKRKEGDKLAEQGDFAKALVAYDEAQAIFPESSVLFARAQVLLKLRRYTDAKASYQLFLDSGKAGKQKDEVKKA